MEIAKLVYLGRDSQTVGRFNSSSESIIHLLAHIFAPPRRVSHEYGNSLSTILISSANSLILNAEWNKRKKVVSKPYEPVDNTDL